MSTTSYKSGAQKRKKKQRAEEEFSKALMSTNETCLSMITNLVEIQRSCQTMTAGLFEGISPSFMDIADTQSKLLVDKNSEVERQSGDLTSYIRAVTKQRDVLFEHLSRQDPGMPSSSNQNVDDPPEAGDEPPPLEGDSDEPTEEEAVPPAQDVVPPAQDVVPPAQDVVPPAQVVVPPAQDVGTPAQDAVPQADAAAAPANEATAEEEEEDDGFEPFNFC